MVKMVELLSRCISLTLATNNQHVSWNSWKVSEVKGQAHYQIN